MPVLPRFCAIAALGMLSATLAACANEAPPQPTNITRPYSLIDDKGRQAGTVLIKPFGEKGEVRDVDGRLIGVIVPPEK